MHNKTLKARQTGFSIIELMVSLLIGFVVILAVSGILLNSKQNFGAQDENAKFQENIRMGTEMVSRTLKHTGHRAPNLGPASINTPLTARSAGDPAFEGTDGSGTTIGNQDTITVRYQGNGLITAGGLPSGMVTNCAGTSIGSAPDGDGISPISFNTFSVATFNGRPWLMCATGLRTPGIGDAAAAPTPLIPDVEGIEVLYGESNDQTSNVFRYVALSGGPQSERVSTIRVFLLFRTENETSPVVDTQTYQLGEKAYGPFNDRRVRRVVEITTGLRNRMP
jgi:type II secretory pathway pseudopilin PulG